MSGICSGLTLDRLPTDDHVLLAVALVLADVADQHGENIYPSVRLVAALARCGERAVQYSLRDLEAMGYLVLVRRGGGRGNPSKYKIDMDWITAQPSRSAAVRATREKGAHDAPINKTVHVSENGAERVHKGCTKGAPACAPEPVNGKPVNLSVRTARACVQKSGATELVTAKTASRVAGVKCWTPEDRLEAERLVDIWTEQMVMAAAVNVEKAGADPLPSRVQRHLQKYCQNKSHTGERYENPIGTLAANQAGYDEAWASAALGWADPPSV